MKYICFVFAFAMLMAGCKKNGAHAESLSEDQLNATLRSDKLFAEYVTAFTTFRMAVISEPKQKKQENMNALLKAEIRAGKIRSLKDYKESYIAKGGSPQFINAFSDVVLLQRKLKRKYINIIEANPKMFSRVVSKNIPNNF